jgi:hypothetical protein
VILLFRQPLPNVGIGHPVAGSALGSGHFGFVLWLNHRAAKMKERGHDCKNHQERDQSSFFDMSEHKSSTALVGSWY